MILTRERQNVFLLLILSIVLFNLVFPMNVVFAANEGSGGADNVNVKVTGDDNASLSVEMGGFTSHSESWTNFLGKYKNFIVGIAGVGAVTMVALFIRQFIKLGSTADNPMERSRALQGVLWTGIAAAALGAVAIITGFFYHAFG